MDKEKAELFALHMLKFIREQWPALAPASLEVGRDDKDEILWCKIHRGEQDLTHGGGYLFNISYLERKKE